MDSIKSLSWLEFLELDEVQIELDPFDHRQAYLGYFDELVHVSVPFRSKDIDKSSGTVDYSSEGHDDQSIWEDEDLAKQLKKLVIEEYENLK